MRWRGLALVALLTLGAASCSQPPQSPRATSGSTPPPVAGGVAAGTSPADPAGPTTVVDGAPMGYRHDAAGARAAGLAFTRLNEAIVLMDDASALAARRATASAGSADGLVEKLRGELAEVRKRWPVGSMTYRVAPLAVRLKESGTDAMRVDVWYVGVVAGRGFDTYEEWVTDTYQLVWERADWRVAALSDAKGPRPAVGPDATSSSAEIEARLSGFEEVR